MSSSPSWRPTRLSAVCRQTGWPEERRRCRWISGRDFSGTDESLKAALSQPAHSSSVEMHLQFADIHQRSRTDNCRQGSLVWCVRRAHGGTETFGSGFLQRQGHLHHSSLLKSIFDWTLLLRRPLQFQFRKKTSFLLPQWRRFSFTLLQGDQQTSFSTVCSDGTLAFHKSGKKTNLKQADK